MNIIESLPHIIGSIVVTLTAEHFLKLQSRKAYKRSIWDFIKKNGQPEFCSSSPAAPGGGFGSRESDNNIIRELCRKTQFEWQKSLPRVPAVQRTSDLQCRNLFVIGSTRFNEYAKLIQKEFASQFEFVQEIYHGEPNVPLIKLITVQGDEYVPTIDLRTNSEDNAVDYGIFFCAVQPNGNRIFWIAGIHGVGSVGVFHHLLEQPETFAAASKLKKGMSRTWLIRINHGYPHDKEKQDQLESIISTECIAEQSAKLRPVANPPPKAFVFDLGNVLMLFDRSRSYRAIAHWIGRDWRWVQEVIEGSGLPVKFELGELSAREFRDQIVSLLDCGSRRLGERIFDEFWGDIFWPNQKMIRVLQKLHESKQVTLVLLSNTNALHFENVRKHFPEVLEPFGERLVLSYIEGRDKSSADFFKKAVEVAGVGVHAGECVYIDDKPEFIQMASKIGMKGILYFKHTQVIVKLRDYGVYIDEKE